MLSIRRSNERGHANHGWLDTHHTFSFGSYHDPDHMGFRDLRVINDDRIAGGGGFPTHPHRDMEIVTVVLSGALQHRDSMGTGAIIRPGEVQRMTAGTGVRHSEFNHSSTEALRLLQIWIEPEARNLEPSYEQRAFEPRPGQLALVASRDGRDGSVVIHQDVALYRAQLGAGDQVEHALAPGRHAWVHVARGRAVVNGQALSEGDAVGASDEAAISLQGAGDEPADVLLFDLR